MGFGTGLGFVIAKHRQKWRWESHGDCKTCDQMEGLYTDPPLRPHENCSCEIVEINTSTGQPVPKVISSRTERDFVGHQLVHIGTVARGYAKTFTTGEEGGGEVGFERGFGISFFGTKTQTRGTEITFREEIGGNVQEVYEVYAVYAVKQIDTMQEGSRTYEVVSDSNEESVLVKVIHCNDGDPNDEVGGWGIGAGEAETGDDGGEDEGEGDDDDGGDDGDGDDG